MTECRNHKYIPLRDKKLFGATDKAVGVYCESCGDIRAVPEGVSYSRTVTVGGNY